MKFISRNNQKYSISEKAETNTIKKIIRNFMNFGFVGAIGGDSPCINIRRKSVTMPAQVNQTNINISIIILSIIDRTNVFL